MKKEYKAPVLSNIKLETESLLFTSSKLQGDNYTDSKKNGRTFEDEEAAPATPKNFWDDEE